MSGCANRRWGVSCNTGGSRPPANPEMDAALAKMRAERDRQDAVLWGPAVPAAAEPPAQEQAQKPQQKTEKR